MTVWHLLFALGIGILCTTIFSVRLRKRPTSAIIWVFLFSTTILALVGVLFIGRFGPIYRGIHWLTFLLVGLLLLIVTTAVTFRPRRSAE